MQQSVESTQAIAESDAVAVERTLAGDRDAYRVLVERHSHNVFRLAYRMSMRQRQKEEARREAPRAEDGDGMENDPLNRVQDKAPTPERLTQSIELRKQMEQALAALSDAERTAFVMRHWEGCGIEEIAEVLKSSSNATKNTVFRAVQKLRHALQPFVETRAQARAMGTES